MKKLIRTPRRGRLSNRLWQYRKRMGFSQAQVAAIVGHVSRDLISHYERGKRMPSFVTAMKLEIVYRVPVSFLFPEHYLRLKGQLRAREERLRARWNRHDQTAT